MIRTFDSKKRLLFAPKAFLNSVARWLLNVRSQTGTIRISNTANPTAEAGPSIDIDAAETVKAIDKGLAEKYPRSGDERLIGPGLDWMAGKLGINGEWLANEINKNLGSTTDSEEEPEATDNTGASTATDAEETFEADFTNWDSTSGKMLKLRLYALVTGESGEHTFHPVDFEFTPSGMLKSAKVVEGKSIFIGA